MVMTRVANIIVLSTFGCALLPDASGFALPPRCNRVLTSLHLEDDIAQMIDKEVDRLQHLSQRLHRENKKNRKLSEMEPSLPQGFDFNSAADLKPNAGAASKIQLRKDKRMARDDPARYCADRCVSTGNCDVWEDMFELSEKEVQKFCTECVLSEDDEPCDVPEAFFNEDFGKPEWEKSTKLRP